MTISTLLIWLLPIILVSAFLTWILYKDRTQIDQMQFKIALPILRFLSFCLVGLLLLNPWFQKLKTEEFEKLSLFFIDNSASLSAFFSKEENQSKIQNIIDEQNQSNRLIFGFSDQVEKVDSLQWDMPFSSLESPFHYIQSNFAENEIAQLYILSDGISNKGTNPTYEQYPFPVHTILAGDTTIYSDIYIERVLYSEIAFLNDEVEFQVDIKGQNIQSQTAQLLLQTNDGSGWKTADSKSIRFNARNQVFQTENLINVFEKAGKQQARVVIEISDNENNKINNFYTLNIDVIDSRQKVGIVTMGPHPDISAIVKVLSQNKNYEFEIILLGEDNLKENNEIDIYVLYDLPNRASRNHRTIITDIIQNEQPLLIVLSPNTDYLNFNNYQEFIRFRPKGSALQQQSTPALNSRFSLYTFDEQLWKSRLRTLPPLQTGFVDQEIVAPQFSILNQKIGNIETDMALHSFFEFGGKKVSIISGTEFFRWPLQEYALYEDQRFFNQWIEQTFQYLGIREDKRKLRASFNKSVYDENERLYVTAQTFNDNFEPIVDAEIVLEIRDSSGNIYPYTLNQLENSYHISIGPLDDGLYTYAVKDVAGKYEPVTGQIQIRRNNLEFKNTIANASLMKELAERNGGQFVYFDNDEELRQIFNSQENEPTLLQTNRLTSYLLDLRSLFFALFALLSIEWFLRRLSIGY